MPRISKENAHARLWVRISGTLLILACLGLHGAIAQTTVAGIVPGQFAVAPSGAATYSVPLQVPPGVAGMQPKLSLEYNSQAGNGMLGMGWNLAGLSSITRCPRTMAQDGTRGGVRYDLNDRYCMDGQRLMLVSGTYGGAGSEYRTERESFSRITANDQAENGPASFTVQTKSGLTMDYGKTADSRIEAQGKTTVATWAVNKITDAKGNAMTVSYYEDASNPAYYPTRIDYAGNSVVFEYEGRPDATWMYQAGSSSRTVLRLKRISSFAGSTQVAQYTVAYRQNSNSSSSVQTITQCDSANNCLPATQFSLPSSSSGFQTYRRANQVGGFWDAQKWFTMDVNGDGLPDLVNVFYDAGGASIDVHLNTGSGFQIQRWETRAGGFWDSQKWFAADVNGDGKMDLINVFNDGGSTSIDVHISTGSGFQTYRWENQAGGFWDAQKWFAMDVNGDGLPDLVNVFYDSGGASIDVHLNTGSGFQIQRWETQAGGFWDSQKWFSADVNGDGKMDLINVFNDGGSTSIDVHISTGSGFQTYRWETQAGGFWDAQKWFTMDVNGDGLPDLVNVFYDSGGASIDVHLNKGSTFQLQRWETQAGGFWDSQKWFAVDVNGDGRMDLVNVFYDEGGASIDVHLSRGDSFQTQRWETKAGGFWDAQKWFPVDINGDGLTDLVNVFGDNGSMSADAHLSAFTYDHRISRIAPGGAPPIDVSFRALSGISPPYTKDSGASAAAYPKVDLQIPLYVVNQVSKNNGLGGQNVTQYSYGGLKAELGTGRGSLGFRWMQSTDAATGIQSYQEFRQDWPYTGMVAKNETRLAGAGSGGVLKRSSNSFECKIPQNAAACAAVAGNLYFPYVANSVEESWDLAGAAFPSITTSTQYNLNTGDSQLWGDPTTISVINSGGGSGSKTIANTYQIADIANGRWVLGRLKRAVVSSNSDMTIPSMASSINNSTSAGVNLIANTGAAMAFFSAVRYWLDD